MCDIKDCYKPPYVEVFKPNVKHYYKGIEVSTWNYLCKKHYKEEFKKYGLNYGWYELKLSQRIKQGILYYLWFAW